MSTTSQITANQTNAQLSTGPRTAEGKAASSQNSACHGLTSEFAVLSHENPAEFAELSQQAVQEFQPSGMHEEFLVRRMIEARWRAVRCQRLEYAAFELMLDPDSTDLSPDARIVSKMQGRGDVISLLHRYSTAALNQYDKAYRELIHGRKQNFKHQEQALDHYIKSVVYAPPPDNGFVSQSAPPAPQGNLALRL